MLWRRNFTPLLGALATITAGVLMSGPFASVVGAAEPEAAKAEPVPVDFNIPQVGKINEKVAAQWRDAQITPSAYANDGEWCRRVYLDVIGRVPSFNELREFVTSKSATKKVDLLNKLLYDEDYTEEYARNWTTLWTNTLIGRNGGNDRRSLISRPGMQKYLRDSFARNKPYNKMVYELVTAKGATTPGHENFNGATNFLVMKLEEKATQATADTSKMFLGLQVQCTQCHNHPFNEWKQQKFWEMNAFFRQTTSLRRFVDGTRDIEYVELDNQDFAGESNDPEEAEVYYELRNGEMRAAYPVFVDGTAIKTAGYVDEVDRRTELGKLMMQSEFLDKMAVNRMWSHFFGYGFTKPIDDLGPHNQPTHPELLDYLGAEFRKNSYNSKELIKWIALSQPYGLSSKLNATNTDDDPSLGNLPKFSHFYMRQMRAEELYESLLVATQAHKTRGSYEEQEKQKSEWLRQFVVAFGTDEGDETTTFNGTIPQALMLFNGELIKQATDGKQGSFLYDVANNDKASNKQRIDYLFLAALSRPPTKKEMGIANSLLQARLYEARKKRDAKLLAAANTAALQDIFWAILNSNEFILNH